MTIELLCFAALRDHFPARQHVPLEELQTIADLRILLERQKPEAGALLAQSRFAVDQILVRDDHSLKAGKIVAVLPPSSGG